MNSDDVRRFSYRRTTSRIGNAILVVAWGTASVVLPLRQPPDNPVEAFLFFGGGFLFLLLLCLNYIFVTSDIEITTDKIAWVLLGWRWKEIRWADVKHVFVSRTYPFGGYRPWKKQYNIFPTKGRRAYFLRDGGMYFNEEIHGAAELKSLLKAQIEQRHIRVDGLDFD